MKQLYKHITTGTIIEAEKYRPGLEDGFINNKPYKNITLNYKLERILISKDDYIIQYKKDNRIFTGLYPEKLFKKKFKNMR